MPCPYDSGKQRKVSFYYRQVKRKPPATPSGPLDCKDKHVEAMPISLSSAEEREITQSLRIVPQSIMPQSAKNGIKGNLNDGNENNSSGSGGGEVKRRVVIIRVLLQWCHRPELEIGKRRGGDELRWRRVGG